MNRVDSMDWLETFLEGNETLDIEDVYDSTFTFEGEERTIKRHRVGSISGNSMIFQNLEESSSPGPPDENTTLSENKIIWTEDHRIILVGVVFAAYIYTGTTSFSSSNCQITWANLSSLFDAALVEYGLEPFSKGASAFKSSFKVIKGHSRKQVYTLRELHQKWLHKLNKNNNLLHNSHIESYLNLQKHHEPDERISSSSAKSLSRKNLWTHQQEVILYGAISEFVFGHGSLHRSKEVPAPWVEIKECFDKYCAELLDIDKIPGRSILALKRHYKEMRTRLVGPEANPRHFYEIYQEFLLISDNSIIHALE